MNKDFVWWTMVNSSKTLFNEIKKGIENRSPILLTLDSPLPWKETFYSLCQSAIAEINTGKSLEYLDGSKKEEPSQLLFQSYVPQTIKMEYWPDQSIPEFLAEKKNLSLHQGIFLVLGIHDAAILENWLNLISAYQESCKKNGTDSALFFLEYSGSKKTPPSEFCDLHFSPNIFDRYIFSLTLLSELNCNFFIKQYIAELACMMSKKELEFCGELAEQGLALAQNPKTIIHQSFLHKKSDGREYRELDEAEIFSGIYTAQIKILFPVIEQFRINFIKSHENQIQRCLPIRNSLNEEINNPSDLELSDLCSIAMNNPLADFTSDEKTTLLQYRNLRNKLAHNTQIEWAEIDKLIG